MTVTIANTNLVDSFNTWRLNTNLAATTISNNVVTVTKTGAARGGTTQGDGHIKGKFTANELRSRNIRGGNTTNESTITLHSNTTVNATTLSISANTEFTGNVNFTTAGDDRIILGDISRIRVTGGNSGDFLRKTNASEITATPLTMRQLGDLSSNSAHIILSSSNTAFSEELNTPDLRFSAGTGGQDVFRVYGDGDSTGGNSDLLIQLVSADEDSNLKIQTSANNTVHTFSADGNFQSTGRLTTVGITTSGTILPSGGSVNIGSGSAKFLDGNFAGTVATDKLNMSTTAGDGVSSDLSPTTHNAKDLGNTNYQWRNIFSSGTATLNNVTIGGTLGTTGDLTAVNLTSTGDTVLGNATTDTITATAQFASALIPSADNASDLGSSTKEWKDLYIDGVANIDELSVATGSGQGVSTSLIPKTDGTHNLGSANREWQNLFIDGTAHIDTLDVDENATFGGTITATSGTVTITTGAISVANITTLNTTGLASLDGGIDVDGVFTVADTTGNIATTGTLTAGGLASLNGGIAVDSTAFTVADTTGNVATAGTLTVAGATILNGDVTLGNASSDAITLNGTIAGTSTFTNLSATGNIDLGDGTGTDTLTIQAEVDSNFIPTGTRNLGANAKRWTNGYIDNIVGRNITLGADGDSSGTNSLTIFGNVTIDGTLNLDTGQTVSATSGSFSNVTASQNLTIDGNSILGTDATDTVDIKGVVKSNIIPQGTRELGSSSAPWEKLHVNDIDIKDDLAVTDALTVGGDAGVVGEISGGSLAISGTSNFAGNVDFDGAITRDGGTVLFDTNGELNASGTIGNGVITSDMLVSTVSGASVGSASAVPVITFNNKGQITAATTATVAGVTGFAVGNGTSGKTFTITTADGSTFAATVGAGSIGTNEMATISGLTATTYGSATQVPVLTVNAKGRVTAASQVAVAGISSVAYTSANNNVRVSTGDGKTHDLVVAPATDSVRGVASFDAGDFAVSSGAVTLKNASTGAVLSVAGTSNEVDVARNNGTVTVGLPQDVTIGRDLTVTRDVAITGDLTVSGTTTTVNSTTVSIADPIFELGESSSDDNLDRGIIMKYNNSGAKKAFMGYDDSTGKFLMIPDATDTSSVISGTAGTLVASVEGNVTGNLTGDVAGNVTGNISSSGTSAFTGTVNFNGATIQNFNAGLTGDVTGNADTATTLETPRTIGGVSFNGSANINLPGVNTAGNQATSGNAATATKLASSVNIGGASFDGTGNIDVKVKTVSENTSTSDHFLTFVPSTTTSNVQDIKEDADLKYKPSTGTLTSAIVSAGTNFVGDTLKNTDNQNVITKTSSGVGDNQFHGNASTATQFKNGVTIDLRWSTDGSPGTGDANAGSIASLTGNDNSIFGELRFPSGGVKIADGDLDIDAVRTTKIQDGAVTSTKLKSSPGTDTDRAVTRDHIRDSAVNGPKLAADAVTGPKISGTATDFEVTQWKVDSLNFDGNVISTDVNTNMVLDASGDILLNADGGDIQLQDGSATFGVISNDGSGSLVIKNGPSSTTMLTGSGANVAFAGNITVASTIVAQGDITAFSDARLKHDVKTIDNALDKVDNLRGVTYRMLEDETHAEKVGVIAQEVEEILPQVVHTSDDEMQTKSVDYGKLCAVLIEAVKELKKEVEELKGK